MRFSLKVRPGTILWGEDAQGWRSDRYDEAPGAQAGGADPDLLSVWGVVVKGSDLVDQGLERLGRSEFPPSDPSPEDPSSSFD